MQLSHWLDLALGSLNASALAPAVLASLQGLLPQLGAEFLMPLSSAELLQLLTQPQIPTYSPAQVGIHTLTFTYTYKHIHTHTLYIQ